jgi:2-polyprenyl-3-methyl-5-hydroxy-6-metoxy-1,4-benzoquinol methylase
LNRAYLQEPTSSTSRANVPTLPPLSTEVPAGRLPGWDDSILVHRVCPACGIDCGQPICYRPDRLPVVRCSGCGTIYLSEVPTEDAITEWYRAYGEYKNLLPRGPFSRVSRKIVSALSPDPNLEILRCTGGISGQTICEIGCSFGGFLKRCRRRGAKVFGVELDDQARACLARAGISCKKSLEAPECPYDVVCAFHVIEHLTNPSRLLDHVAKHLKVGGRFLLALPNGGEAEVLGPSWIGYRVDLEHLNYFRIGPLSSMLREYGLYVEHYWESLQPAVWPTTVRGAGKVLRAVSQLRPSLCQTQGRFELRILARKWTSQVC